MRQFRLVKYIYAGLFAAALAVLSQIAIPIPGAVPLTLQTFGVALCAYVLGIKYGSLSYLIYFLLGLFGVPVFSNFTGGFSKLFGTTGGFLIGFFFLALGCGLFSDPPARKNPVFRHALPLLFGILGLLFCHLTGVLQVSMILNTSFAGSFFLVSAPYLVKDLVSIVAAFFLAKLLRRRIR